VNAAHLRAQLVATTVLVDLAALPLPVAMVIPKAGQYTHPAVASSRLLTIPSGAPKNDRGPPPDDGAVNPGSNLFVTGIHPRLSEQEVTRLFEKYGDVEKCQIMLDPHTKESRGFGFVKMVTAEQADAAKEGLQGEVIEGRTLSIEKARRSRPRTPTPGKYFGPPKRGKYSPRPVCYSIN
jgi:RNA recognition motif. (a.k.a. RRM, RBD, or RNP domain)